MQTFTRLTIFLIIFSFGFLTIAQGQNNLEARINALFQEFSSKTPGVMVSIVKKNRIIYSKGLGSAQLEYGIPINEKTVFHIASDSKRFTALAILLLEKRGLLKLSNDIRQYFPKLPNFGHTITIKNLLQHTSGLRDQWQLLGMAGMRMEDVITQEHILSVLFKQRALNFKPGEEFTYCNTGYTLLAEIVAKVSGQSFEDFTQQHIFRPLGMRHTHFHSNHKQIIPNRAYSYNQISKGRFEKEILNFSNVGATSLFTTAEDLQKWLIDVMSDHPKVAHKQLLATMQTKATLPGGDPLIYGMGEMTFRYKGLKLIGHGGNDAGFNSFVGYFPDQEIGVIALSNSRKVSAGNLVLKAVDLLIKEQGIKPTTTPPNTSSTTATQPASFITPSKGVLATQTGVYETVWGNVFVKEQAGQLYFKNVDKDAKFQLFKAVSKTQYFNEGEQLVMKFTRFKNKRYQRLKITGPNNTNFSAKRIFLVDYSIADLKEFVGTYASKELETQYKIVLKDSMLVARHTRFQDIPLSLKSRDRFTGKKWFFGIVAFIRNPNGQIEGMLVSGRRERAKNVRFDKVK